MTINFEYTNKLLKKMDRYVFFLCSDVKKDLIRIQKLLNIEKIPKKLVEDFKGKIGDEKILYLDDKEIYFLGYGKNDKCDEKTLYNILGSLGRNFNGSSVKNTWIELIGKEESSLQNQIIGFLLGIYSFEKYKSNKKDNKKNNIQKYYFYHKNKKFNNLIEKTINEGLMQNRVRDLINEPANELTSTKYVQYIKSNLNKKVKCKVLNENELKKKGLNLILAVNAGSKNPCYLVILEYTSSKEYEKEKPICLVGKGVMFDSGGLNIKLHDFSDMKEDMAGSAIMYGIINLLAENQIKGKYMAFLPIVENMVDAKSTRPGDIIKSYSGKTVEIIDTDCEGRLLISDAINYTKNYNPKILLKVYLFSHLITMMMI